MTANDPREDELKSAQQDVEEQAPDGDVEGHGIDDDGDADEAGIVANFNCA